MRPFTHRMAVKCHDDQTKKMQAVRFQYSCLRAIIARMVCREGTSMQWEAVHTTQHVYSVWSSQRKQSYLTYNYSLSHLGESKLVINVYTSRKVFCKECLLLYSSHKLNTEHCKEVVFICASLCRLWMPQHLKIDCREPRKAESWVEYSREESRERMEEVEISAMKLQVLTLLGLGSPWRSSAF